jgi:hypothetical protein
MSINMPGGSNGIAMLAESAAADVLAAVGDAIQPSKLHGAEVTVTAGGFFSMSHFLLVSR